MGKFFENQCDFFNSNLWNPRIRCWHNVRCIYVQWILLEVISSILFILWSYSYGEVIRLVDSSWTSYRYSWCYTVMESYSQWPHHVEGLCTIRLSAVVGVARQLRGSRRPPFTDMWTHNNRPMSPYWLQHHGYAQPSRPRPTTRRQWAAADIPASDPVQLLQSADFLPVLRLCTYVYREGPGPHRAVSAHL